MDLKERIIAYIQNHHPITYERLEEVAMGKGFNQLQIMEAMEAVHRDKRVIQTTRGSTIQYRPYIAPPVKEAFVQTWKYPWPGRDGIPPFVMPFPDWDLSWIFLKPDELEKYKAEAKGQTFTPKQKWQHQKVKSN